MLDSKHLKNSPQALIMHETPLKCDRYTEKNLALCGPSEV
jgi:hypothetical protein